MLKSPKKGGDGGSVYMLKSTEKVWGDKVYMLKSTEKGDRDRSMVYMLKSTEKDGYRSIC